MKILDADYSKNKLGQLKIQQMAFVLVALVIFFALVGLIYFSFRVKNIESSATGLKEDEAKSLVKKLVSTPEFSFTVEDCSACVDLDKVLSLKGRRTYEGFWNLDYLAVEKIYPSEDRECEKSNYPECNRITIINTTEKTGEITRAFVALCRWEDSKQGYFKCELGQIMASGEGVND